MRGPAVLTLPTASRTSTISNSKTTDERRSRYETRISIRPYGSHDPRSLACARAGELHGRSAIPDRSPSHQTRPYDRLLGRCSPEPEADLRGVQEARDHHQLRILHQGDAGERRR